MIKDAAYKLIKIHRTNDPLEIASRKNISVLFENLGDSYGFFSTYRRMRFIHINCELNETMKRFVCAHELGHAVLHPKVNTPFLRHHTLLSIDKIEREANQFAVELLMPDDWVHQHQYLTIYEMAATCGVPREVVHLKKVS